MGANAEDPADHILRQHLLRRPRGDDLAFLKHRQPVAEHRRQIEIVQRDDAGDAELRDQRENVELMLDIEMVGRLVEQQFARRLRQRSGNMDALALTARQRLPELARPLPHARPRQGLVDGCVVSGAPGRQQPAMRRAAEPHHVAHRQLRIRRRLLLDEGDAPRKRCARQRGYIVITQPDDAAANLAQLKQINLRRLDLPEPFGPSRPNTLPLSTVRLTPLTMTVSLGGKAYLVDADAHAFPRTR